MECNQNMEPEEKIELTENEHFLTNQINKNQPNKTPKTKQQSKTEQEWVGEGGKP